MFTHSATIILYNFILFACPCLCYFAHRNNNNNNNNNNRIYIYIAYFIILLFTVIRYDIGADYENYARGIINNVSLLNQYNTTIQDLIQSSVKEPALIILSWMYSFSVYPHLWVIGTIGICQILLLYKILDKYNQHIWGLFIYIITFNLFQSWDWVRQSMAILIFLYSLRYIDSNKIKFIFCICLSMCFHYSSACLFIAYFIKKWDIKSPKLLVAIVIVLFVCAKIGLFSNISQNLSEIMILYNADEYTDSKHLGVSVGTYHTTTYTLVVIWYISWLYLSEFSRMSYWRILFFIGIIFYIIAGGNLILERISFYFTSIQILLIGDIYKNLAHSKKLFCKLLLVIQFAIFNGVYISSNFRGCTPYETIFSKDCTTFSFRTRDY